MRSANHFLSALPDEDYAVILPILEEVILERDEVVNEAHTRMTHVHLPVDCILSVITVMRDGAQVESRTVGREGGHGLLHVLGADYSHEKMLCQIGGKAVRIPLDKLRAAAEARPALVRLIAEHAQATSAQLAQAVACNVLHPAHARLANWLVITRERIGRDVLPLTQEHLSIMLGVQRTTVNPIAQHLQDKGVIHYSRGKITILDPQALYQHSCRCGDDVRRTIRETTGQKLGSVEPDPAAAAAQ